MGILGGCLKIFGSAALVVTGTASTVLKGCFDAAGVELGSELFGATKDASFNGIREIWDTPAVEEPYMTDAEAEDAALNEQKRKMKIQAIRYREWAEAAQKAGNTEKYEEYMAKYQAQMEAANELV